MTVPDHSRTAHEIKADILAVEENSRLRRESDFSDRMEAIDRLEFEVIDRIEGLLQTKNPPEELSALKKHAETVKRRLEGIDEKMFRRLGADIAKGGYRGEALRTLVKEYVGRNAGGPKPEDATGYDNLDLFINGLLHIRAMPPETRAREPEMVHYQKTPARIVFALPYRIELTPEDVFYDLGSGLGQVPILVNLLTGAAAKGVEIEPAFCDYSRNCAADLNLSRVEFINEDARRADYADGTVFFMYSPFEGKMLQDVLEHLRLRSRTGTIRLFSYGPCTRHICGQDWLERLNPNEGGAGGLGIFKSR